MRCTRRPWGSGDGVAHLSGRATRLGPVYPGPVCRAEVGRISTCTLVLPAMPPATVQTHGFHQHNETDQSVAVHDSRGAAHRPHMMKLNSGDPGGTCSIWSGLWSMRASSPASFAASSSSIPTSAGPVSRLFFLT